MLTIVGNIFQSLTERFSIHRFGPDIHLRNCIASPMVVAFVPSTFYTTQFSVVLKNATSVTSSTIDNPQTQIFISGHLSLLRPYHIPSIEVPRGDWFFHNGDLDEDVAEEFRKALVHGQVYVTDVCWDFNNQWESHVKVVDCSVGKMIKIQLFTMDRSCLKQIAMLRRGDRIHIQGCIPPGVRQKEGIFSVKINVAVILWRDDSTRYGLRGDPKQRFNLTAKDWKPQQIKKKGSKKSKGEKKSKLISAH